jgi:hypothetical protein
MALQKFVSAWTLEFNWVVPGKDDFHALCNICHQELDIAKKGKKAVTKHNDTIKHKDAAKSAVENRSILKFAKSTKWSSEDEKVSAAEGAWSYHISTHGQSFSSADCVSSDKLFQSMFPDPTFSLPFLKLDPTFSNF